MIKSNRLCQARASAYQNICFLRIAILSGLSKRHSLYSVLVYSNLEQRLFEWTVRWFKAFQWPALQSRTLRRFSGPRHFRRSLKTLSFRLSLCSSHADNESKWINLGFMWFSHSDSLETLVFRFIPIRPKEFPLWGRG